MCENVYECTLAGWRECAEEFLVDPFDQDCDVVIGSMKSGEAP